MTPQEFLDDLYRRGITMRIKESDPTKIICDTTYAELTDEDRAYVRENRQAIISMLAAREWDGTKALRAVTEVFSSLQVVVDEYVNETLEETYHVPMKKVPVAQITHEDIAARDNALRMGLFQRVHPRLVELWKAYHARDWQGIESAITNLQTSVYEYIRAMKPQKIEKETSE